MNTFVTNESLLTSDKLYQICFGNNQNVVILMINVMCY